MKHLILTLLIVTSCTTNPPSVTKESWEIVSDYTDTLENSISDAKSVVGDINERNEKIK